LKLRVAFLKYRFQIFLKIRVVEYSGNFRVVPSTASPSDIMGLHQAMRLALEENL